MRKALFFIGCVLFVWGLFVFVGGLILCFVSPEDFGWKKDINRFTYITTVIFFVGTYLISNNKPEEKE